VTGPSGDARHRRNSVAFAGLAPFGTLALEPPVKKLSGGGGTLANGISSGPIPHPGNNPTQAVNMTEKTADLTSRPVVMDTPRSISAEFAHGTTLRAKNQTQLASE
jgi:hypothetical protein